MGGGSGAGTVLGEPSARGADLLLCVALHCRGPRDRSMRRNRSCRDNAPLSVHPSHPGNVTISWAKSVLVGYNNSVGKKYTFSRILILEFVFLHND